MISDGGDFEAVRVISRDTKLKLFVQRDSDDIQRYSIHRSHDDACSLPIFEMVRQLPEEAVPALKAGRIGWYGWK